LSPSGELNEISLTLKLYARAAEPVVAVSHQTMVNWTSLLPRREEACPVKTTQKSLIDSGVSAGMDCSRMDFSVCMVVGSLSEDPL
jgi:hypothetical protein